MNRLRMSLAAAAIAGPLALAGCTDTGDVDVEAPNVDVSPGAVDVETPEVEAPDAPDVDVDPGELPDVDVEGGEAPDVNVEENTGGG